MLQPTPREFLRPSATTAFIGVLLAFLGVSDLTALSMSEEVTDSYWGTQTPVRLAFLFALTGYSYAFKPGGVFGSSGKGAGDNLKNSVVFAFGFVELSVWFWVSARSGSARWDISANMLQVFLTLREERRQRAVRLMEKRRAEQNML